MDKKDSQRLNDIDIAKGIGILLMYAGHILTAGSLKKMIIYSFHMPLFFILSGYTFSPDTSPRKLIRKRTRDILIPYLIWAVVYSSFSLDKLRYLLYGTNESIRKAGSAGPLWFLPCMWLAAIAGGCTAYYCSKSRHRTALLVLAGAAYAGLSYVLSRFHTVPKYDGTALGLPLALDVASLAACFYLFGIVLRKLCDFLLSRTNFIVETLLGILLLSSSLLGILSRTAFQYQRMASYDIDNVALFLFTGTAASTGVILLSHAYARYFPKRCLMWIGRNSLLMYVLHPAVLQPVVSLLYDDTNLMLIVSVAVLACCTSVLTLLTKKLFYKGGM